MAQLSAAAAIVAKVQEDWEDHYKDETEEVAEISYKLQNPAGPLQIQIMEVEKFKQMKKQMQTWKKTMSFSFLCSLCWII